jgi:biotin operon repressor
MNDELLALFKALADASRLKIVGLLAQHPYSGEELSALLGLKPSTVSHHLSKLAEVGLVSAKAEKTRLLFSHDDLVTVASAMDADAYDRKVIRDFTHPDGSLTELPAQRKKREAVLRHLVKAFEPGRRYSEKQVNEILSGFHSDTASLRRELVGYKLMQREGGGGDYWREEGT